jgi:hypothetical protein
MPVIRETRKGVCGLLAHSSLLGFCDLANPVPVGLQDGAWMQRDAVGGMFKECEESVTLSCLYDLALSSICDCVTSRSWHVVAGNEDFTGHFTGHVVAANEDFTGH